MADERIREQGQGRLDPFDFRAEKWEVPSASQHQTDDAVQLAAVTEGQNEDGATHGPR